MLFLINETAGKAECSCRVQSEQTEQPKDDPSDRVTSAQAHDSRAISPPNTKPELTVRRRPRPTVSIQRRCKLRNPSRGDPTPDLCLIKAASRKLRLSHDADRQWRWVLPCAGARQLVCREPRFREAIIFDVRSARRACALTVQASAQPHRACLPPLAAGSRRGLWPLP